MADSKHAAQTRADDLPPEAGAGHDAFEASEELGDLPPAAESRILSAHASAQAAAELQAFKTLQGRSARRKRNRRLRIAIGVVGGIAVLAVAFFLLRGVFAPAAPPMPMPTDIVTRGDYIDSIRASGNLAAYEQVTITPEVDGTVIELYVGEGDTVEAGQLLFVLDNPDLDTAVTMAQRGVDSANLSLRGAQTARNDAGRAVDKAWAEYEAIKQAFEDAKLLDPDDPLFEFTPTQADVDMAYEMYRNAASALDSAKLSLEGAQMGLNDAQKALDDAIALAGKRKVYAPISGQVVVNNLERGTKLSTLASSGQVPMQVADITSMRMTISISESEILAIEPGMHAVVSVGAIPGYTAEAEVLRVASTSSGSDMYYYGPSSGVVYYDVDLLISQPDPRLKIGMSADAEVVIERLDNVLMVSSMAVQFDGSGNFVQVMDEDGNLRNVAVRVLAGNGAQVVVEGDLKEGDTVLLDFSGVGGGMGGGRGGGMGGGSVTIEKVE